MGDTSDGYPGLKGWGAKSASQVLAKYGTVENIPRDPNQWKQDGLAIRGAEKLAAVFVDEVSLLRVFKELATLRTNVPLEEVSSWQWDGPHSSFEQLVGELDATNLVEKVYRLK